MKFVVTKTLTRTVKYPAASDIDAEAVLVDVDIADIWDTADICVEGIPDADTD